MNPLRFFARPVVRCSVVLFLSLREAPPIPSTPWNWLSVIIPGGDTLSGEQLKIDIQLRVDALSLLMLLIVTGVGGAIHIYSYAYMHDEPGLLALPSRA